MGIGRFFEQVVNVVRGKANEAADALENPVRDGKLAIEDATKELERFKVDIANVMSDKKNLERELQAAKDDVKKYKSIAKQAKDAGNEEDALKALEVMNQNDTRVRELTANLKMIDNQVTKLRTSMEKRRDQVAGAQRNITQLQARQRCANIRKAAAEANDRFGNSDSPFVKLNKLEGKVLQEEDQAEALEELSTDANDDLESKYDASKVDLKDQLAKL